MITRAEVRANRLKWSEFLQRPETKKAVGMLESVTDNEARCCLGHACHVLGEPRHLGVNKYDVYYGTDGDSSRSLAPSSLKDKLGLYSIDGSSNSPMIIGGIYYMRLTVANDDTVNNITPQQIGAYLQTVTEGGKETPFRSLTDYPE